MIRVAGVMQYLDLEKSFAPSEAPEDERRIVNTDGKEILGSRVWTAGMEAIQALQQVWSSQGVPSVAEIRQWMPELAASIQHMLDHQFFPDLARFIDDGVIGLDGCDRAQLDSIWTEYSFAAKAGLFFQIMGSTPVWIEDEQGVWAGCLKEVAALATLECIDDCVLATWCENGVDEAIADVERFRQYVKPPRSQVLALRAAKLLGVKAESKRRATKAADDRHGRPGGARAKVAAVRAAWASGKYGSRDDCADEEARALGWNFWSARRALTNTPDPPGMAGKA